MNEVRLIDANALKEKLNKTEGIEYDSRAVVEEVIDNAPTVIPEDFMNSYEEGYERARKDFERPQGKWVKSKDGYTRCDQCGSRGSAIKSRFCHHCGAKMQKGGV